MRKLGPTLALAAAFFAVAGCFRDKVPPERNADPAKRVYLKEAGLAELKLEDIAKATPAPPASIEYLNLDYNSLTNVDALAAFTSLKWLRLNENRLSSLPDLSNLKSLRRIYLRDNAFSEVPGALKGLPALDTVDLSGNGAIKEIPEWFAKKEGLAHLSLSRTGLTRLPADLTAWKSLKTLQLGDVQFADIEEMKRIRKALPGTAIVF